MDAIETLRGQSLSMVILGLNPTVIDCWLVHRNTQTKWKSGESMAVKNDSIGIKTVFCYSWGALPSILKPLWSSFQRKKVRLLAGTLGQRRHIDQNEKVKIMKPQRITCWDEKPDKRNCINQCKHKRKNIDTAFKILSNCNESLIQ